MWKKGTSLWETEKGRRLEEVGVGSRGRWVGALPRGEHVGNVRFFMLRWKKTPKVQAVGFKTS